MWFGRSVQPLSNRVRILTLSSIRSAFRPLSTTCRACGKQKQVAEDQPITFSSSKAASWSLANTVMAPERDVPWYQPLIISISLLAFCTYFFFLREENDLDIELNASLFERVPHLEESQLKVAIDYYRQQGRDTRELEQRYAEVLREKASRNEQDSKS